MWGTAVAFSVVSGGSSLSYQWQVFNGSGSVNVSGSEYSGATTATLTISPVGTNDAGIYTCTVGGVNGSGWGSAPGFITVPVPPAPAGLVAVAGNGEVTLSWAASANATSYNVYGLTSTGTETFLVTNVTTTSYTNMNLTDQ